MYCGLWLPESNPPLAFPSVVGFCVWPVAGAWPLENGSGDFAVGYLHQTQFRMSTLITSSWDISKSCSSKQLGGRSFPNKLLQMPAGAVLSTLGFGVSSCWWCVSFLWRISECFSRWEWGRQLTVSLMDSAAAKRLDSADTHWPRESSERTMTTQRMSRDLEMLHTDVCRLFWRQTTKWSKAYKVKHANVTEKDASVNSFSASYRWTVQIS